MEDKTISQLSGCGELKTLERNLQQIQSVEDEKLTLRQQMTELEVEVQCSKSLSHYLEFRSRVNYRFLPINYVSGENSAICT
jgi:hypothetical protein